MEFIDTIINGKPLIIFSVVMGIMIYLSVKIKMSKGGSTENIDKFLERERASLFVPKKDLPKEMFMTPSTNLPFSEINHSDELSPKFTRLENEIKSLQTTKMLKPSPELTNTDLREQYGSANLENIIIMEQNYTKYIHFLNELSVALIVDNQYDTAEKFLLEANHLGSDVSLTYICLIDIYEQTDKKKLDEFLNEFAKNHSDEKFYVNKVLNYVKSKEDSKKL